MLRSFFFRSRYTVGNFRVFEVFAKATKIFVGKMLGVCWLNQQKRPDHRV